MNEREWIKSQGKCCFPGCDNAPTYADNQDNVFVMNVQSKIWERNQKTGIRRTNGILNNT